MAEKFIRLQILYSLVDFEPYFFLVALIGITWFFYKFFLGELNDERHRDLWRQHRSIFKHFAILTVFLLVFLVLEGKTFEEWGAVTRITPYVGLLAFIWGNVTFVKTSRLLVLQYLYIGHMREGVPLLVVNVFSLLLSIVLVFWGMSHLLDIQLAPLLATSAAFSIVLGLAMQETLGNLFAGISLQLDKSFEIGDWIEVMNSGQKAVGQVKELTWRSTVLSGTSDELITLPNRLMAQSQISNFSPNEKSIIRSQTFRVPLNTPFEIVRKTLEQSVLDIHEIRGIPTPYAYVSEVTESWVTFKLVYSIESYGLQNSIGDKIQRRGIEALQKAGISLAKTQLEITYNEDRLRTATRSENP